MCRHGGGGFVGSPSWFFVVAKLVGLLFVLCCVVFMALTLFTTTTTKLRRRQENMRKKMQERERRRVLQRFNPDAIRQVAESTADELTRARLLAIVGENLRRTGADRSPQQQQALEELNKASHQSVGARRVRYVFVCVRARERCPVRLHRQTRLTVFVYLHFLH